MQIKILQISPTKDAHISALEKEYEKRLQAFAKLETITLPASKSDDRNRVQSDEREHFLKKLDKSATIIALDERGKEFTSQELADFLLKERDFGPGHIQFLIGGSHGLHPDVLALAHHKVALSKMTFTHEMVRVFLKEQVYRAFTILAGKRYHK